jgi:AcrR family transcriptional regulator
LGLRDIRKQATRERVLEAARDLFDTVGYEETTIRMIAERAKVSVGSVFTSFSAKAEILSHVMDARLDRLYAELDQVVPHLRGSVADRLCSIMAVHYGFETRRLRLFVAYISASYTWTADQGVIPLGRNMRMKAMLVDTLRGGVERGEVRRDADLELFADTLVGAYVWNYRLACYDGADSQMMTALMDRQIGLMLDGVTPK